MVAPVFREAQTRGSSHRLVSKHFKNVKKASELHRGVWQEEPTACLWEANLSTILRAGADWNARRV